VSIEAGKSTGVSAPLYAVSLDRCVPACADWSHRLLTEVHYTEMLTRAPSGSVSHPASSLDAKDGTAEARVTATNLFRRPEPCTWFGWEVVVSHVPWR
jgi:hypothetical protein